MRPVPSPIQELGRQIKELQDRHPALKPHEAFVAWFLTAFAAGPDREEACVRSLTGASRDKGMDAVFVDDDPGIVYVVQGKISGLRCRR